MTTLIAGIGIVTVAVLPTAISVAPVDVVTIEQWRIPSARLRRASSRWRWGSAPSHPSYSSSSVTSITTDTTLMWYRSKP